MADNWSLDPIAGEGGWSLDPDPEQERQKSGIRESLDVAPAARKAPTLDPVNPVEALAVRDVSAGESRRLARRADRDAAAATEANTIRPDGDLDFYIEQFRRGSMSMVGGLNRTAATIWEAMGEQEEAAEQRRQASIREGEANKTIAGETSGTEVWENPSLSNVSSFIKEQGIASIPQMALAVASIPTYVASLAGQIAQQRAGNDGRENAELLDLVASVPAATVSAYLDRLPLEAIFTKALGGTAVKRIIAGVGYEAGTEAIQSPLEYAGGTIGTDKGFSAQEALKQSVLGAVAGGGMGGALAAATEGGGGVAAGAAKVSGNARAAAAVDEAFAGAPSATREATWALDPNTYGTGDNRPSVPLNDGDVVSFLPTEAIQAGKNIIGDILGERPAKTAPAKAGGLPSDILSFLRSKGYDEGVARGIAAGIVAESRGDHTIRNPTSDALGLGQWLGPRKAALLKRYGPNPTRQQQLEFLHYELQGGDFGGKSVLAAKDERGALDAYINKFMRPAKGAETTGDISRGLAALGLGESDAAFADATAIPATVEQQSPTPTAEGFLKSVLGDDVLEPTKGERVDVTQNGETVPGTVEDIWEVDGRKGARIALDDGTTFDEALDDAREFGARITKKVTQNESSEKPLDTEKDRTISNLTPKNRGEIGTPLERIAPEGTYSRGPKGKEASAFTKADAMAVASWAARNDRATTGNYEDVTFSFGQRVYGQDGQMMTPGKVNVEYRGQAFRLDEKEVRALAAASPVGEPVDSGEQLSSNIAESSLEDSSKPVKTDAASLVPALKEIVSKSNVPLSDVKKIASRLGVTEKAARAAMGVLASQPNSGFYMTKGRPAKMSAPNMAGRRRVLRPAIPSQLRRVARRTKPLSAMEFVRSIGGVQSGRHDLRNMGALARYPGVLNKKGSSVDEVGRALHEAGYFTDRDQTDDSRRPTEAETLDFLSNASLKRSFTVGDQGDVAEEPDAGEVEQRKAALAGEFEANGYEFTAEEMADAQRNVDDGLSVEAAVEAAIYDGAGRTLETAAEQSGDDAYLAERDAIYDQPETDTRESGAQESVPGFEGDEGDAQGRGTPPAQSDEASQEGLASEGRFKTTWVSKTFRAVREAGGDPHRESPVAAALVRGYLDGQKGDAVALAVEVERATKAAEGVQGTGENVFNPRQAYLEGYYAGATGNTVEVRAKGGFRGILGPADVAAAVGGTASTTDAAAEPADVLAERPGDARTALERQADKPLRGTKTQKAPGEDGGLFDTQDTTGDMFNAPAEPKMSAALAAAERQPPKPSKASDAGIASSRDAGAEAFKSGASRVPPAFLFDAEHKKAWLAGWDGANLAPSQREIPADLKAAQEAYMAETGNQISQTEIQRLSGALAGGMSIEDAVRDAREFYDKPIDWNAERAAFKAETDAKKSYGGQNKIFTAEAADKARALLKDKLRNQINSGFDPEIAMAGMQIAGFHIEAGVRKFADLARAIADDLGTDLATLKPYIAAWYNGARDMLEGQGRDVDDMDGAGAVRAAVAIIPDTSLSPAVSGIVENEGQSDVSSAAANVEPDRAGATASDPAGGAVIQDAAREDGLDLGEAGSRTGPARSGPERGGSLFDALPAVVRAGSADSVRSGSPRNDGLADPAGERGGSRDGSVAGQANERDGAEATARSSVGTADLAAKLAAQRAADSKPVVTADLANIAETLPYLTEQQHGDVLAAEQRFKIGDGMLFTNGTGTGKTFTGGGIVARSVRQGKGNILIVAPSQGIISDWIKVLATLGVEAKPLASTADAGEGVSITTYANMASNPELATRQFDLVVPDESHTLMSGKDAENTKNIEAFRALTNHPKGRQERARRQLHKRWATFDALREQFYKTPGNKNRMWRVALTPEQMDALDRLDDDTEALAKTFVDQPRSKVVFLSATPFAYVKNIEYAEGYLFEYGEDDAKGRQRGYNEPDPQQAFMIQHFGYRMRTNKLTQPDAGVDNGVMEREFHEHLKKSGALSGRVLDENWDYDRKFVLIDDAIGNQIDQALDWLRENRRFSGLEKLIRDQFSYLNRMRLLEAIKAHHAVPIIKEHLALGRKIVVFHDYNQGTGFSPFEISFLKREGDVFEQAKGTLGISLMEDATTSLLDNDGKVVMDGKEPGTVLVRDLYNEFVAANPYVKRMDFKQMRNPIETLTAAFPTALLYNGTVSKGRREQAKADFNRDGSSANLIVVQAAAGQAGISLHDTTGKHKRVLLNLGMPVRPTAAIQEEGRIYRIGQQSDAVFRYFNTGTTWERHTFASVISERASTAENLALGNLARALKQSFIDAFIEADAYPARADDGLGGKKRDKADNTLSPFERSKTFYWAQQKRRGSRDQREGVDYFSTPEPVGFKMGEWASLKFGEKVLEPSAGHGAIARFLPERADRTLVEPSESLATKAELASPGARVVISRFEELNVGANKFDGIVMNPPFGMGGKTAFEHVTKAAKHLRNGGRLIALVPAGPSADKRFEAFRDAHEDMHLLADVKLPNVTFERAGTAVATHILVFERQTDKAVADDMPQAKTIDLTGAKDVNELFDRIEGIEFGDRREPLTQDVTDLGVIPDRQMNYVVDGISMRIDPETVKPSKMLGSASFKRLAKLAEKYGGSYQRIGGFKFEPGANENTPQENRDSFLRAIAAGEQPVVETVKLEGVAGVTFDLAETKHSKTGEALFVATIGSRVEREDYQKINAVAKANGGYYSTFRGAGAIPGFQFKSAEARAAFVAAANGAAAPGPLYQAAGDPFYSALERAVEASQTVRANAGQWKATLKNTPGVKAEELEWSGLLDWLDAQEGQIDRATVLATVRAGGIHVDERILGEQPDEQDIQDALESRIAELVFERREDLIEIGDGPATHFAEKEDGGWRVFGERASDLDIFPTEEQAGRVARRMDSEAEKDFDIDVRNAISPALLTSIENEIRLDFKEASDAQFAGWSSDEMNPTYRELLITIPVGEGGNPNRAPSTHWDQEAVVAHARFMDKTDADGKRVLFVEEVQSDWHQKGRDQGYEAPVSPEQKTKVDAAQREVNDIQKALTGVETDIRKNEISANDLAAPLIIKAHEAELADIKERAKTNPAITQAAVDVFEDVMGRNSGYNFFKQRTAETGHVGFGDLSGWIDNARSSLERTTEDRTVPVIPDKLETLIAEITGLQAERRNLTDRLSLKRREVDIARDGAAKGIPNAPFKSSWPALVMKRLIRYAAENGYDRVAWTTGEEQNERYNLSQAVGSLTLEGMHDSEGYRVRMAQRAASTLDSQDLGRIVERARDETVLRMTEGQMRTAFGNDIAQRVIDSDGEPVRGDDLRVGGDGMKAFYDRNLVNITNDIIKKYGAKVGPVLIGADEDMTAYNASVRLEANQQRIIDNNEDVTADARDRIERDIARGPGRYTKKPLSKIQHPGFDITDKMRDAAMQGFPLFRTSEELATLARVRDYEVRKNAAADIKRLLPGDKVALEFAKRIVMNDGGQAQGTYWRRVITLATEAASSPRWTLAHEAVHAMKAMGLFTPGEWKLLENKVKSDPVLMNRVRRDWRDLGLTEDQFVEEGVAELFGEYWSEDRMNDKTFAGRMANRFLNVLLALVHAIDKLRGVRSVNRQAYELVKRMASGEIGSRNVGYGEAPRDIPLRGGATVTFGNNGVRASVAGSITPGSPEFSDPASEARWKDAAKGIGDGPGAIDKAKQWWADLAASFTRHWKDLPTTERFADVGQQFRKLEAAPDAAMQASITYLRQLVGKMDKAEFDLFSRKVVMDDLAWEASSGRDLPFGFTPQSLKAARQNIDALVAVSPKLIEAVRLRKAHNKGVADAMVAAGVLTREEIKNPAYFRHMVLDYARSEAKLAAGPGSKIKSPYWAKRLGSLKDINANILEAELDWLQKAQIDIATAKTIEWIKTSSHNIRERLRTEAKASNTAGMDALKAADPAIEKQDSKYRQAMGFGFSQVQKALASGSVGVIPRHLQAAADAVENGARGGDAPFALFAWMIDNKKPGAMGAQMVLKAIGQKKSWERNLLGDQYLDPENVKELVNRLKPEGYKAWQPIEGRHLFTAKTVSEHTLDMFVGKLSETVYPGVDKDELHKALTTIRAQLVVGGDRYTMVLPAEIADTLTEFGDRRAENMVVSAYVGLQSAWKRWVLINPRRFLKYNINNMTGDLDAIIAGNPGTLRKISAAWTMLRDAGKGSPGARYTEALERGVFTSGLSVQEIPDINRLSALRHLTEDRGAVNKLTIGAVAKVWRGLQDTTNFRENLFRLAAYLDYVEKIERGDAQVKIGYGASVPKMVEAVTDPKDKAALLARDLVGDYGAISVAGAGLRRYLIPFWSWTEINTKRYWRLTGNAYRTSKARGIATGGLLGAGVAARVGIGLAIRMGMVYGLLYLWNHLLFGDEEEDLGDLQKRQMHLILGRDSDGEIITLRTQGALSDVLSTFGFPDAMAGLRAYQEGQGSIGAAIKDTLKAPVNRIITGITPLLSSPFEQAIGKELWPDAFDPRDIKDRARHLFANFSLENEYDQIADRPTRGYGRSWAESLIYRRDPGEMAFDTAKGIAYEWLERVKGQEGGGMTSPRSAALRDYRNSLRYGDQESADEALLRYEAAEIGRAHV